MTVSPTLLDELTRRLKAPDANVPTEDLELCLVLMEREYSKRRPFATSLLIAGAGSSIITFPAFLLAAFSHFGGAASCITSVECPATADLHANTLHRTEWQTLPRGDQYPRQLQLLTASVGVGSYVRLHVQLRHQLQVGPPVNFAGTRVGVDPSSDQDFSITALQYLEDGSIGESAPSTITVSQPDDFDAEDYLVFTWTADENAHSAGYKIYSNGKRKKTLGRGVATWTMVDGGSEDNGDPPDPGDETTETTIPSMDWGGCVALAAYHGCHQDANANANDVDQGSGMDGVDRGDISTRRVILADRFLKEWNTLVPKLGNPASSMLSGGVPRQRDGAYGPALGQSAYLQRPRR